jgi:hypothetical protein
MRKNKSTLVYRSDLVLERMAFKLLGDDEKLEWALSEGRMLGMLSEALDDSDVAEMRDAVSTTKTLLNGLIDKFGAEGLNISNIAGIGDYITKLSGALEMAEKSVSELDLEDAEGITKLARKYWGQDADASGILRGVLAVQNRAALFADSLRSGGQKMLDVLGTSLEDTDREKPLVDIAGIGGIPTADKLETGILKALEQGVPKKGFFSKLAGVFSKGKGIEDQILGDLEDPDLAALATAMMDKTYAELERLVAGQEGLGEMPSPPAETIADATTATSAAPGGGVGGSAADDAEAAATAAEDAAAEAGDKPFGAALMDVVAAFAEPYEDDEVVMDSIDDLRLDMQNAFKGRRDDMKGAFKNRFKDWFGGLEDEAKALVEPDAVTAIADAFGDVIDDHLQFESMNRRQGSMLKEVLLSKRAPNLSGEIYYSEDELVQSRWLRIAGLEEED